MKNYYQILGVSRYSDEAVIRDAFKALMLADQFQRDGSTEAVGTAQDFAEAFSILNDPDRRKEYDAAFFGQNAYRQAIETLSQALNPASASRAVAQCPTVAHRSGPKKMLQMGAAFAIIALAGGMFLFERASAPPAAPYKMADTGWVTHKAASSSVASPPVPALAEAPDTPGVSDSPSDERRSAEVACVVLRAGDSDTYNSCLQHQVARQKRYPVE